MATPSFLIAEMRHAFRSCAHQHKSHTSQGASFQIHAHRSFSTTVAHLKKAASTRQYRQWPYNGALPSQTSPANQQQPQQQQQQHENHLSVANTDRSQSATSQQSRPPNSTEIVPQEKSQTAVGTRRSESLPLRAIPPSNLAPGVSLSARERLHIEVMTRRALPKTPTKPIYRERLQIYHIGGVKERAIVLGKMMGLVSVCAGTFIFAPAQLSAGIAIPTVAFFWLCTLLPLSIIHYYYTPIASRVFLRLPTKARETSKTAMEYARNLPRDVELEIEYMQPWGLPRTVKAKVSDLKPEPPRSLPKRNLTVSWNAQAATKPRFSPTGFYLQAKSALGAASKNTIPGLWENVYQRLVSQARDISPQDRWSLSSSARANARTAR